MARQTSRRIGIATLLAGLLLGGTSVARGQAPEPSAAEIEVREQLRQVPRDASPQQRLEALDRALDRLVEPTRARGMLLCAKGATLVELDRKAEALEAFERCRPLVPDEPDVLHALAWLSTDQGQAADAARYLISLIRLRKSESPTITVGVLASLRRELNYAREFVLSRRLSAALVENGWFRDDPLFFSDLVTDAIRDRLDAGNVPAALELLPEVTAAGVGARMLVDRRFEAIWPRLESWAGESMRAQREATVLTAKSAYDADPSAEKRLAFLTALSTTGQRDAAIDGFRTWLATPGDGEDGHERSLAASRLATALASSGRPDLAVESLEKAIESLDPQGQLNVAANLAALLVALNRNAEADALLGRFRPADGDLEAPAANGYFYALRACALNGLGKQAEARKVEAQLMGAYSTNRNAVVIMASCLLDTPQLIEFWKMRLANEDSRDEAIMVLETARFRDRNGIPAHNVTDAALRQIHDHPEIIEAYRTYARPIPAAYEAVLNDFVPPSK